MLLCEDLMTRDLVTLDELDGLPRAEELLKLHHIRHLPVVRQGKLVGVVTHRDLLRACALGPEERVRQGVWAQDLMTRKPVTVRPETPLREAVRLMLAHKVGCLPVVAERGRLVGLLTEADLVRYAGYLIDERDRQDLARAYEADA